MGLCEIVGYANEVIVYYDNDSYVYSKDSIEFDTIINSFNDMCLLSKEMPAFGVSLHNETINAITSGLWVEFVFDKAYSYNEMSFDSLLINVDKNFNGFNIIRKHEGQYSGRCFYIDLFDNDMSSFYDTVTSIN